MIGRIQRSADFERVLGSPSRARSAHFAVHHITARPSVPGKRFSTASAQLSTTDAPAVHSPVDGSPAAAAQNAQPEPSVALAPDRMWLGCVVPKRNAKRSVTRSLMKRQIRSAFGSAAAAALPPGLWVVRLRAPFEPKQFPSAASDALNAAVRAELAELVAKLLRRTAPATSGAT
ncbi:ribonuclease P protein component [Roseateles sp.]|jgi:ribonuclease P protein component|uniref:ribonuclease P protein component n=1 Tax=Roseateles sp. TaxID=1971397 RepID=UPI0037C8CA54